MTALYSIRDLSRLTGLRSDRIRAWERRYGFLAPVRTASGRRLYEVTDLKLLLQVQARLRRGERIGSILKHLDDVVNGAAQQREQLAEGHGNRLLQAVSATLAADMEGLRRLLADSSRGPARRFFDELAHPFLEELGALWSVGELPVWLEHAATLQVRSVLASAIQLKGPVDPAGPRALLFTPAGELHEVALLGLAAYLVELGFEPINLGPNTPLNSVLDAARRLRPEVAAVSLTHLTGPVAARTATAGLLQLAELVPVVAGGRGAARYRKEITRGGIDVIELSDFPAWIRTNAARSERRTAPTQNRPGCPKTQRSVR